MFEIYDNLVSMYLANMERNQLSENSVASYERTFRFFRESMEKNGFQEPCPQAVMAFKLQRTEAKPTTLALYLTHLRLLSEFGVSCGLIADPFVSEQMMPPKKTVAKERHKPYEHVLTEADMRALISAQRPAEGRKTAQWEREKAEVTLMVQTGLRNIELRTLRPCDLDWENEVIYPSRTKGDKARAVPFPAAARAAVRAYLASGFRPDWVGDEAPLFGYESEDGTWKGLSREKLSERVYQYTRRVLGEEKACRTHAARHCYASVLLDHGVDMQYISETMGHSSVATTKIYAARFHVNAPAAAVASVFDAVTA